MKRIFQKTRMRRRRRRTLFLRNWKIVRVRWRKSSAEMKKKMP